MLGAAPLVDVAPPGGVLAAAGGAVDREVDELAAGRGLLSGDRRRSIDTRVISGHPRVEATGGGAPRERANYLPGVQLQPVYGERPLLVVDLPPTVGTHPAVAQRRRLQEVLEGFDDADWQHASRCDGWTVQDVITHLTSTNQFWAFSIAAGQGGEPTEFLATFDPVTSPAQMVEDAGPVAPSDTLAAFSASNEALLDLVEGLNEDDLQLTAESPAGHVPIEHVLDHALWDSWIHERDVLLPLGRVAGRVPRRGPDGAPLRGGPRPGLQRDVRCRLGRPHGRSTPRTSASGSS